MNIIDDTNAALLMGMSTYNLLLHIQQTNIIRFWTPEKSGGLEL